MPSANPRTTTPYQDLLARQDWVEIRKKLKAYAYKATGCRSMSRAEDCAHDVVARVWTDVGVRWDPEIEPSFFRFLTGILRGELSNERRLKRTSSEVYADEETIHAASTSAESAADVVLELRRTAARTLDALRKRTAHDPIGTTVVELFATGTDGASEQSAESHLKIEVIRLARRRIFDHGAAIQRESEESEVE